MRTISRFGFAIALAAVSVGTGLSQDPRPLDPPKNEDGGWRRVDDPRGPATVATASTSAADDSAFEQDRDRREPMPPASQASMRPPAQIIVPAGTWITIRVNDPISSDRNLSGDQFMATLSQPLVADGFVVARRGQTVGGRVVEVQKAGRVKGTSRLGIELTEVGIVDGRQFPLRTQLVQFAGGTSLSRDATSIGAATGVGAAIGAAADGGFGAGMGAIAGAGASAIGVLLTRGRATVIDPETELTFRIMEPVTISTERTEQAFQSIRQQDYEPRRIERRPQPVVYPGSVWGPWGGGWGYPGWYSGGWYGRGWYGPGWGGWYGPRVTVISGGRGYHRRR